MPPIFRQLSFMAYCSHGTFLFDTRREKEIVYINVPEVDRLDLEHRQSAVFAFEDVAGVGFAVEFEAPTNNIYLS